MLLEALSRFYVVTAKHLLLAANWPNPPGRPGGNSGGERQFRRSDRGVGSCFTKKNPYADENPPRHAEILERWLDKGRACAFGGGGVGSVERGIESG